VSWNEEIKSLQSDGRNSKYPTINSYLQIRRFALDSKTKTKTIFFTNDWKRKSNLENVLAIPKKLSKWKKNAIIDSNNSSHKLRIAKIQAEILG
jgi:hypothetical protein